MLTTYQGPSPLVYPRAPHVQRFGLLDPELVDLPFEPHDSYFAEQTRTVRRGTNGQTLKRPRIEVTPGALPGTLAWLDWHHLGGDWVYVDFVKVRSDARGGRYASKLVEAFYREVVEGTGRQGVHWGRVLHANAWTLMQRMKRAYPTVLHAGYPDF